MALWTLPFRFSKSQLLSMPEEVASVLSISNLYTTHFQKDPTSIPSLHSKEDLVSMNMHPQSKKKMSPVSQRIYYIESEKA